MRLSAARRLPCPLGAANRRSNATNMLEQSAVGRTQACQNTVRLVLSIHRCGRATEHGRSMPARERLAQASVACRRPLFALRTLLGELGRAPSEPAQSWKRSRFRSSECRGAKGSSEIPPESPVRQLGTPITASTAVPSDSRRGRGKRTRRARRAAPRQPQRPSSQQPEQAD